MAYYCSAINTDAYKPLKFDMKEWERGTLNDFMRAINGWSCTERTLTEVMWRMQMFTQQGPYPGAMNPKWEVWSRKRKNSISFRDVYCDIKRSHSISVYGIGQGYICLDAKLSQLRKEGYTRIYFSDCYDIRQGLSRITKGCFMEIMKISKKEQRKVYEQSESVQKMPL